MKKKLIIFSLLLVISLLSYKISWINYFLLLTAALAIVFLLFLGLISIFKKIKSLTIKIPVLIILLCLFGTLVSLFRPYEEPIIHSEDTGQDLEYAYKTDQNDRKELRSYIDLFSKLNERDEKRLQQVKRLYSEGEISEPREKFHAAFIFHHSDNSKDYKLASLLASQAANAEELKDEYQVQWLQKAAYDRYMLSIGKPEKYNTQNKFSIELAE